MIEEPRCFSRNCNHFTGVKGEEPDQVPVCKAFPDGIPDVIAYGNNNHTMPFKGDGGIRYQSGGKP